MRLLDAFRRGAAINADRACVVDGDTTVSWGEARDWVEDLAAGLTTLGLKAGDRIGVFSPNSGDAFLAVLALIRLGAVWVPVNARNTAAANESWLDLTDCAALLHHSALEEQAADLARSRLPLDRCIRIDGPNVGSRSVSGLRIAGAGLTAPEPPTGPLVTETLFATGGTSSLSRAAEWISQTWEHLISASEACLGWEAHAIHLVTAPMTHAAGVLALCGLNSGATNVFIRSTAPAAILQAIEERRITHLYTPPTLLYSLLAAPELATTDTRSLRRLLIAAAPVAKAKLQEAVERFGPVVCQSYGQAEAPMFLTFMSATQMGAGGEARWSACGLPVPPARLAILNAEGAAATQGEVGEIAVRGGLSMRRYFRNDEATAAALSGEWRRTGDIGLFDADGYLHIVDRAKDVIITGGFNVYSTEVEQVILEHPAILDCAVIGVPDAKWGEAVKAVVQLKSGFGLEAGEVLERVRTKLGPVDTPKTLDVWLDLPRSPTGKVLKRDIRASFWKGSSRLVN